MNMLLKTLGKVGNYLKLSPPLPTTPKKWLSCLGYNMRHRNLLLRVLEANIQEKRKIGGTRNNYIQAYQDMGLQTYEELN